MTTSESRATLRFAGFELDMAACELRCEGRAVRLERRPMDLLVLLVGRRGQLVSRGEIVERLWGNDVHVDVETGVNTIVWKLRAALRDSPDAPTFVQTVPGRGYRFLASVEVVSEPVVIPGSSRGGEKPLSDQAGPGKVIAAPAPESLAFNDHATRARHTTVTGSEPAVLDPRGTTRWRTQARWAAAATLAVLAMAALLWPGHSRPDARITVAVLPFENLGSDPERQYLADGLTEETSASLAQIDPERLSVKGRAMAYKGTTKGIGQIGQELAVDYLVESSIRGEGGRLRLTSRLIRVRDQEHVWSQSYEREPASLLGLQQELSMAIAEQVHLRLSPERRDALARRLPRSADAYDLYLRGRNFENHRTPAATRRAIEYYERATALDPNYSLAWSGLAFVYSASTLNGDALPLDMWPRARAAAVQAVKAGANLAEAQMALGSVNWQFDWDWPAAEAAFRRAVALDSSSAPAHWVLGHALSQTGRHSDAQPFMRRARELDPLEPMTHAMSSQVAFQGRDYAAAVTHARRAIAIDPEFWIGHMQEGQAYEQLGRSELALAAFQQAARFSGGNSKAVSIRGYLLARLGRVSEAREVLGVLEATARERYVPPYAMALVHAGLGDHRAVFKWLDRAYDARDVHLMFLPVDPKWDAYRDDARFEALLERCGFTRVLAGDTGTKVGNRESQPAPDSLGRNAARRPPASRR
jgi:TolB-like protein/DNA-binding winged helix-turn-helix (wHTH) protein/Flp pilus assembly protein TadD